LRAVYQQLLGREADSLAFESWEGPLERGELSFADFFSAILESDECKESASPRTTYKRLLQADHCGLANDVSDYVEFVFGVLFGRRPDDAQSAYWETRLDSGELSCNSFLDKLLDSQEFQDHWVSTQFYKSLHRGRVQLVRQLPKARVILDLGGGGPTELGALLALGYPYSFEKLTIVEMPLINRHESYSARGNTQHGVVTCDQGTIEWNYRPMTETSGFASQSVDFVFCGEAIEHIEREEGRHLCREAFRILRPGGFFCLDTPNREVTRVQFPDGWIHPEHKHEYTHEELSTLLKASGFVICDAKGVTLAPSCRAKGQFSLQECTEHEGMYDAIEDCYLLYYRCQKRGPNTTFTHTEQAR
jgi:predicted SAM-dependent methyltransferase